EGFTARVELSYTDDHAEQVAQETGRPVSEVLDESRATLDYVHDPDADAFLVRGAAAWGQGARAGAVQGGRLFVYGEPRDRSVFSDYRDEGDYTPSATADALGIGLVTGPLRSLAGEGGLEGEGADGGHRLYTGPLTGRIPVQGEIVEEQARGTVEVDADGRPVRMDYEGERWRVLTEFAGAAPAVDPQRGEELGGEDLRVLHAPVCGTVDAFERNWEVTATAWEMGCDRAMEVSGLMEGPLSGEGTSDRVQYLQGYSGTGVTSLLVDDEVVCVSYRDELGDLVRIWYLSSCVPGRVTGVAEFGYEEVEEDPSLLIVFDEA
ncbi:hypothetical protein, partial [Nocardiopsis protaetiae]